ncbi:MULTISPECIES: hypothetical protein [Flagellimonas]|uniref:Uncharacterized protein n=1 Tax=Flagellimonas hadalis TaxID=2597517 RepID=A0A5N5INQ8_9FLAO|nr:hypothetical protein [Allomuricauda hadalis]KAB5488293.1 hypothetical protein FOT42_010775 [Allomuricauda hadalis]
MEYALQLQVRMILIKKAEHLMDYLSLVVVEANAEEGTFCIGKDTPEPLYSILARNFDPTDSFVTSHIQEENSTLLAYFQASNPLPASF